MGNVASVLDPDSFLSTVPVDAGQAHLASVGDRL